MKKLIPIVLLSLIYLMLLPACANTQPIPSHTPTHTPVPTATLPLPTAVPLPTATLAIPAIPPKAVAIPTPAECLAPGQQTNSDSPEATPVCAPYLDTGEGNPYRGTGASYSGHPGMTDEEWEESGIGDTNEIDPNPYRGTGSSYRGHPGITNEKRGDEYGIAYRSGLSH